LRTSHPPFVRVFKKQYGLSSCHGPVIFKCTRMHSRGRRRPQGTYIGLCSEMQPDAQRRSSHVLCVTLTCAARDPSLEFRVLLAPPSPFSCPALRHPTRACSCRNRQSCVAGSTTCAGTNSYRGPPRIRAPLHWGSRSWTTSSDAAGSTAGGKKMHINRSA
jgi:hypothetical protein